MIIYNYDAATKEYAGSENAFESPLEEGVYLIPANATEKQPPQVQQNEAVCFNGQNWEIKPDYRGQKQVEISSKNVSIVSVIGNISAGFQLVDNVTAEDIIANPHKYEAVNNVLTDISSTQKYKQTVWENEFISTSPGWLRINTSAGDLLSLMNSFEVIARINGSIPAESLLFYAAPGFMQELSENYICSLQFWNEEMTYGDFAELFKEITQAYLERFKGN